MKKLLLAILTITLILTATTMVSARLCQNSQGYYDDCDKPYLSYDSNKNNYINNINPPTRPIFKGSYGNYRYIKYANGDTNPPRYFVSTGITYPSAFNGGYGGYGGYGYYGSPGYFSYGYSSYGYSPYRSYGYFGSYRPYSYFNSYSYRPSYSLFGY